MEDERIIAKYKKVVLDFTFEAGTSRGVMKKRTTYWVMVSKVGFPSVAGYGEAGPLPLLSEDDIPEYESCLSNICRNISRVGIPQKVDEMLLLVKELVPQNLPSIRFAFETAFLDLLHGGVKKIVENDFFELGKPVPINGLIWMGNKDFMLDQIRKKLEQGFSCIKVKIGAIDFKQECEILSFIRKSYSKKEISIRVDANGAFEERDAKIKLITLAKYDLHSIEQPVKAGQLELMRKLCRESPIPIALDEELIGIHEPMDRRNLLESLSPSYIILKPSLLGGILTSLDWIKLAESLRIGWWMTSALESNIGLNAIAQLTSSLNPLLPQGLGTGQLFRNNIQSPLEVRTGNIIYNKNRFWEDPGSTGNDWNE